MFHAYSVTEGLVGQFDAQEISRALRRAVMARVQVIIGKQQKLAPFFTGHNEDGTPIRGNNSSHLSFAFEPKTRLLLILPPHFCERRAPAGMENEYIECLNEALKGFSELRAGRAGKLALKNWQSENDLPILGSGRQWKNVTSYVVNRHGKGNGALETLTVDLHSGCRQIGLPIPAIEANHLQGISGVGLVATTTLTFDQVVCGPIILGRNRFLGGGLFVPVQ